MVTVKAYPRLHVGLMDLGDATFRRYGGCGFTIAGPNVEIVAELSSTTQTFGFSVLDSEANAQIGQLIQRFQSQVARQHFRVTLKCCPPQHIGLGTKTTLLLSVLEAINVISGSPLSRSQLQTFSGRGGASGVGVNSFFSGGFLADLGHEKSTVDAAYLPSSFLSPPIVPPVLCRFDIPLEWRFHLFLMEGFRVSGDSERTFFDDNTPIPKQEVFESLAFMYHGVIPSVVNEDIGALKGSLERIHKVGFKARELQAQSELTKVAFSKLTSLRGCAVGLSSLGPLIYAICSNSDPDHQQVREAISTIGSSCYLGEFPGSNHGREVSN